MTTRPSYAHMAHHASFEHERLKLSDQSIRLFQVQRGGIDEPICLRMTQFSAHRRPKYKAVSYTWGSSADPRSILVNGKAFPLHQNLWHLLYHLRLSGESSFLWADALCINQLNLKERNFHVQLMGRIYQAATSVIVWLGVPSPDRVEIHAFNFVTEIAAYRKDKDDSSFINAYFSPDSAICMRWTNLFRMTDHYYWHRTWIIQEFLFAPSLEVFCGKAKLEWTHFESLVEFLRHERRSLTHPVIPHILQSRTTRLTLRRLATDRSSLHELLKEYSDSTCTERRDKVYGILGLAADCAEDPITGEPVGVKPDYNKHILDVYIDALECIRPSLTSAVQTPAAALLLTKALHIDPDDVSDFLTKLRDSPRLETLIASTLSVAPNYVSTVLTVFQWTSVRDLQAQLEAYEWGTHVGYEVKKVTSRSLAPASTPKARLRRNSSRTIHASLPTDFISNVIEAANLSTDLVHLHNYPPASELEIPFEYIRLHSEDKRSYANETLAKPSVILEQSNDAEILRLGFACTNVQRGDQIVQFKGLDRALIMRQTGYTWSFVGKAMMIRHSQVICEEPVDPICGFNTWASQCWSTHNPDGLHFTSSPLALAEILMQT